MVIKSIEVLEQISQSCMKITADTKSVFFVRTDYLRKVQHDEIFAGAEFSDEQENDLLDAALAFAAETKARDYLSRAEQSRFMLTRKLTAKKFDSQSIARALDFLENEGALSDARFARAWLYNRNISRAEGKQKLLAGLLQRGVSREIAATALDMFCAEKTEDERLSRAFSKILRSSKAALMTKEKVIEKLIRQGFSYKDAKKAVSSLQPLKN